MTHTLLAKKPKAAKKKENFTYRAPDASEVLLVGTFTDWESHPVPLHQGKDGIWKASVSLEPGAYEYRFIVDGEWHDDQNCATRRPNAFGVENCVREVD